ncbi:MAG: hypothetical protein K2P41_10610, partial [Lachnospiraceae bacterium]|nr:hypothetical protein [Lachnospiraceae bacterium]
QKSLSIKWPVPYTYYPARSDKSQTYSASFIGCRRIQGTENYSLSHSAYTISTRNTLIVAEKPNEGYNSSDFFISLI